jgi:hypothetical protein
MDIQRGSRVVVRTAFDTRVERRALSGVEPGVDFPVVWVCTEEEWAAANQGDSPPEGDPWPAEDVALVEEAAA